VAGRGGLCGSDGGLVTNARGLGDWHPQPALWLGDCGGLSNPETSFSTPLLDENGLPSLVISMRGGQTPNGLSRTTSQMPRTPLAVTLGGRPPGSKEVILLTDTPEILAPIRDDPGQTTPRATPIHTHHQQNKYCDVTRNPNQLPETTARTYPTYIPPTNKTPDPPRPHKRHTNTTPPPTHSS